MTLAVLAATRHSQTVIRLAANHWLLAANHWLLAYVNPVGGTCHDECYAR